MDRRQRHASLAEGPRPERPLSGVGTGSPRAPGAPRLEFATTLKYRGLERYPSVGIIEAVYVPPEPHRIWHEIARVFVVWWKCLGQEAVLLNSSTGLLQPDLLASVLLGLGPRRWRPKVVLVGEMWQPDAGFRRWLQRLLVRAADRAVARYTVQSTDDARVFPDLWGVDAAKMRVCHYFYSFTEAELAGDREDKGYIFSGGNSHRDYDLVVALALRMPDQRFVVASHRLDGRTDLPENLTAAAVPHDEFVRLMRAARVVLVPIPPGLRRSTGQQTYLNAMMLEKPTVVCDSMGVRDHVTHMENGFVVAATVESCLETLTWILDPGNAERLERIVAAGRTTALRFTREANVLCHAAEMRDLIDRS